MDKITEAYLNLIFEASFTSKYGQIVKIEVDVDEEKDEELYGVLSRISENYSPEKYTKIRTVDKFIDQYLKSLCEELNETIGGAGEKKEDKKADDEEEEEEEEEKEEKKDDSSDDEDADDPDEKK